MNDFADVTLESTVKRVKVGFVGSIEKFYCEKEVGVPLLRTLNLTSNGIDYCDLKYVTKEFFEKNIKSQIKKGDILIARHGDNGKACVYEREEPAQALNVVVIEPDEEKMSTHLLSYFLEMPYVKQQISGSIGGSVQGVINTQKIAELLLPFRKSINYKKVEELILHIDNKRKTNNLINKELESMARTIYDYWFLQFDFPDENGKPYKSSGGKMVWNEELKSEIPDGWESNEIGDLIKSKRGISYSSATIGAEGVPMINLASFNTNGTYKISGIKTYSGIYEQDKVLKPYDLLMCNTQQTAIDFKKDIIGKAILVPDIFEGDIVYSHHVTVIKPYTEEMKYYLYNLFNSDFFHKYIAGYTNGTNILGLLFDGVEKYKVIIPCERVLNYYSNIAKDIEKQKSKIIKENQELTSLRDFLLPLLMNGQVGFKEC